MVRALEQLLRVQLERRELQGFDYLIPAETANPRPGRPARRPASLNRRNRNN
jgi:hypothetical protein